MRYKKTLIITLLCLLVAVPVPGTLFWLHWSNGGNGTVRGVEIESGTTIQEIADRLMKQDLLRCPFSLRVASRLRGADRELRAGYYFVPDTLSPWELVQLLRVGSREFKWVTLPEGLNSREVAARLAAALEIDAGRLLELMADSSFATELGVPAPGLEGYLFPDTYRFFHRQDPASVLTTLVQQHQQVTVSLVANMAANRLTSHELVTLASIIQGEMLDTSEAWTISSVYHNRLQAGWKLQADPTVQYLLTDGPRRLLLEDLEIDSPYNTYLYHGLPPGPVNNPGAQALAAARRPAFSDYYFFVADGTGKHLFSRNAEEHARARTRLDQLRRQLLREQ